MPGWMKHKLESFAGRDKNNLTYAGDTILMAESEEPFNESERGE